MLATKKYDVVIIGGSYAGLSAGMALGRAIRNVLIVDGGKPCNIQTPHSHNFLTQDGNTPARIAAIAKEQLSAYPTVEYRNGLVTTINGKNSQFEVSLSSGENVQAKKLLFATGIKDVMPDIPGFAESWGISVIHCPYCHGYEYREQPTGILINGDMAFEFGRLINHWAGELSIFTNGKSTISAEHRSELAALNIIVNEKEIKTIDHSNGSIKQLMFKDGSAASIDAMYARLPFEQHCQIPKELGCALDENGYIQVDDFQKTTVPGIYAAGDNTTPFRAVAMAVSAGSRSGAMVNHELIAGK
ncbi:NAD(P)/FAD-dependent oxidoreductase [Pedobacter metabolipauper]|uniref:Thioredoxin reductase n=1 Tax=Pedobacter metabolipauper TaxID=425513 RepID=A0A4R6SSF2_9SPHI|nr:NAD(P)/FAD-dependent oxidoreductase [Pedobacter metabolipauper]TDQ06328.1 thioredoxin reductase [Pedobacter metabolipauper]